MPLEAARTLATRQDEENSEWKGLFCSTIVQLASLSAYITDMKRIISCALAFSALMSVCAAQDATCKSNRKVVGKCFTIRGRLNYWNGTPSTRIWIIGTHRVLGLPGEDSDLPSTVKEHLRDFNDEIYANFEVCPFEKYRKGEMQMVCVKSASNVRVKRTNDSER